MVRLRSAERLVDSWCSWGTWVTMASDLSSGEGVFALAHQQGRQSNRRACPVGVMSPKQGRTGWAWAFKKKISLPGMLSMSSMQRNTHDAYLASMKKKYENRLSDRCVTSIITIDYESICDIDHEDRLLHRSWDRCIIIDYVIDYNNRLWQSIAKTKSIMKIDYDIDHEIDVW